MAETVTYPVKTVCAECNQEANKYFPQATVLCLSCRVRLAVRLRPPTRVPWSYASMQVAVPLTPNGFSRGYEVLTSTWKMPHGAGEEAFYAAVRQMSDVEWMDVCRLAVAELDRRPTPPWLKERAIMRRRGGGPKGDREVTEWRWMYVCHSCGYESISATDDRSAPTVCGKCARARYEGAATV